MNNAKWYFIELPYFSDITKNDADRFKQWLHNNNIKFETSGAGSYLHFEIYATLDQVKIIDKALDEIVW